MVLVKCSALKNPVYGKERVVPQKKSDSGCELGTVPLATKHIF